LRKKWWKSKKKASENGLSINAFKCDMRELEKKIGNGLILYFV